MCIPFLLLFCCTEPCLAFPPSVSQTLSFPSLGTTADTHTRTRTHMLRLENTGGGEEKHAIWTDEEAKGEKRRRKHRKMEVVFVVPHEEQTATSAEGTLASVLLTRGGGGGVKAKRKSNSICIWWGKYKYTPQEEDKKNARSSPTDAEKRIDMYSFSIYLFPRLQTELWKKSCFALLQFFRRKMREGVRGRRSAIWGTEGGIFREGERERKTGARVRTPGKTREKRGEREMSQAVKAH